MHQLYQFCVIFYRLDTKGVVPSHYEVGTTIGDINKYVMTLIRELIVLLISSPVFMSASEACEHVTLDNQNAECM